MRGGLRNENVCLPKLFGHPKYNKQLNLSLNMIRSVCKKQIVKNNWITENIF